MRSYLPRVTIFSALQDIFRFLCRLCLCLFSVAAFSSVPSVSEDEAPRARALLDQAWAAESGRGIERNPYLAAILYRQAGDLGSAEGFYRAALLQFPAGRLSLVTNDGLCLLVAASQLGHASAGGLLERVEAINGLRVAKCDENLPMPGVFSFDLVGYVSGLSMDKQKIAATIRRLAVAYKIDPNLALAIATAESNFNPGAVSPKMAMGVMQLIPETAERFNVRNPFDPEQNIRGGLAYLRWLKQYFGGDMVRVVAAYNAGEGAVLKYNGVPPYKETISYVNRVMSYSGRRACASGSGKFIAEAGWRAPCGLKQPKVPLLKDGISSDLPIAAPEALRIIR